MIASIKATAIWTQAQSPMLLQELVTQL